MPISLGEKIRHLRTKKAFTLDRLAELSGSSKSYIWELENKHPPRPSAEKLAKIAECLDTTLDYLLSTEEDITEEDATDAAFYRRYRRMDQATKLKIQQTIDLWGEEK